MRGYKAKDRPAFRTAEPSVVAERLAWLIGQKVEVTMTAYGEGEPGETVFDAVYVDTIPAGREYFFVFNVDGKRRLVRTVSVIQIDQLGMA